MRNLLAEPAEISLARLQRLGDIGREAGSEEIAVHNLGQPAAEFRHLHLVLFEFGKRDALLAALGEHHYPGCARALAAMGDRRAIPALVECLHNDARFVTESANPHNRFGVRQVEATYPAPVLTRGVALIDTPGIGSTFRHNTEATVNFLPQCDAALFVVSADPPITEVEVEFLKLAHRKLARLFFILNKVDYLDADERREAVTFLQHVLCEQLGLAAPPPIFCASARQGLTARRSQDAAAWQHSGMAEIEYRIVDFLLTEKTEVLQSAAARQAHDILADVERRLRLTVRCLQTPLAELDERIRLFEDNLNEIEEQRIVFMNRLGEDEERLADSLRKRAEELLPKSMKFLRGVVQTNQDQHGAEWAEELARETIAAAIPGFFEREFGTAHQLCEQELRDALLPRRRRANELLASVHQLVERLFGVPFEPQQQEISLAKADRPYWRTHKWVIRFGAIPESWIDRLFPQRWRTARIRRRIMEQVEYLVTRNIGDLQWSTVENLKQSVQTFRDTLNEGIQQAIQTTRRALDSAVGRRTEGSATVAPEIARLESAMADLRGLRGRLDHVDHAGRLAAHSVQGNGDDTTRSLR